MLVAYSEACGDGHLRRRRKRFFGEAAAVVLCDCDNVVLTCGYSMFRGISPAGGGMFEDRTRSGVRKRGGGKGQDRRRATLPTSVRHIDDGRIFGGLQ